MLKLISVPTLIAVQGSAGDIGSASVRALLRKGCDVIAIGSAPLDMGIGILDGRLEKVFSSENPKGIYQLIELDQQWGKKAVIEPKATQVLDTDLYPDISLPHRTFQVTLDSGTITRFTYICDTTHDTAQSLRIFIGAGAKTIVSAIGIKEGEKARTLLKEIQDAQQVINNQKTPPPLLITAPVSGARIDQHLSPVLPTAVTFHPTLRTSDTTGVFISSTHIIKNPSRLLPDPFKTALSEALVQLTSNPLLSRQYKMDANITNTQKLSGQLQLVIASDFPKVTACHTPDSLQVTWSTGFDNQAGYVEQSVVPNALALASAYSQLPTRVQYHLSNAVITNFASVFGTHHLETELRAGQGVFNTSSCTSNSNMLRLLLLYAAIDCVQNGHDPELLKTETLDELLIRVGRSMSKDTANPTIQIVHAQTKSEQGKNTDNTRISLKPSGSETDVNLGVNHILRTYQLHVSQTNKTMTAYLLQFLKAAANAYFNAR